MELHQIRYFLAVHRMRNFTRAAEHCNITQPALTRAIQKLEEEVGGKLFSRRPGRVDLTELGRTVLPHFASVDSAVSSARANALGLISQRKQRLRLGIMCTLGPDRLMVLIKMLIRKIPDLEIQLTEAKGADLIAALINDDIDIGLVGMPHYPEDFDALPLYTERYMLAVPATHRFATAESVPLAELDGEDYIERLSCEFDDHFVAAYGEWPIDLNMRFQSQREDWVQAMIGAGLGIAILPETLAVLSDVARTALVAPEVRRTISLVRVRNRVQPLAALEFYRIVRTHDWSHALGDQYAS